MTWPDGQIILGPPAFRSPAYLAAIIAHETYHFEQYTTPGKGDRLTFERSELEAFGFILGLRNTLGLSDDEVKLVQETEQDELSRGPVPGSPFVDLNAKGSPPDEMATGERRFYQSWQSQAAPLVDEIHAQLALRERFDREERENRIPEKPAAWAQAEDWASRACSYLEYPDYLNTNVGDPTAVGQAVEENDRIASAKAASDRADRAYMLSHTFTISRSDMARLLAEDGDSLPDCNKQIIGMFMQAPGVLDARSLVAQLDYQRGGGALGAVVRGLADAIHDGTIGVLQALKDAVPPAGSGSSSSGGSSGDYHERSERGSSEGHTMRGDGPAMGQLRGIGAGGGFD